MPSCAKASNFAAWHSLTSSNESNLVNVQQDIEKPRIVEAEMNYAIDHGGLIRFHAKNSKLDTFEYDPRTLPIVDARGLKDAPRLNREGFALMSMPTAIDDFRDRARVHTEHPQEIAAFIQKLTNADEVIVAGPAALRFGERAKPEDRAQHSKVARLIHSDTSIGGAEAFAAQYNLHPDRRVKRTEHHNIWRSFSPPPQDLPLALCDFRSVSESDLILAEAAFDDDAGRVSWAFEALLAVFNPNHRWFYFSNMTRDEVLVFKRYDSDRSQPWFVPHSAFIDPSAPAETEPRASIEMRTIAYWYE